MRKVWGCGSVRRALARHTRCPEFGAQPDVKRAMLTRTVIPVLKMETKGPEV